MITWPAASSFPAPKVDFGVTVSTQTIRTKMDSGRTRQRSRFTRNMRQMSASWKLSDFERSVFQSIYASLLTNGADWFYMDLPLGDGFKQFRVRFVADSYAEKHDSVMYWNVSARMETEDTAEAYDEETIEAFVAVGLDVDAFEAAGNAFHVLINETFPELLN